MLYGFIILTCWLIIIYSHWSETRNTAENIKYEHQFAVKQTNKQTKTFLQKSFFFRSHNINSYIQPQNTLRSLLVVPKDADDRIDQCGVVYQWSCTTCPAFYVHTRTEEHFMRPESPVAAHATQFQRLINSEGIKILDREDKCFWHGVKEAIHIKQPGVTSTKIQGNTTYLPWTRSSLCHMILTLLGKWCFQISNIISWHWRPVVVSCRLQLHHM